MLLMNHPIPLFRPHLGSYLSHASHFDGDEESAIPLDGYDRIMNYTATEIVEGTIPKLHMGVDAGTETVEAIIDPSAQVAGKCMRYMILNEDISRPTSNL